MAWCIAFRPSGMTRTVGVFVLCNVRPSLFPDAIGKMLLDLTLGAGGDWVKRNRAAQAAFDFDIAVAKKKRENARRADSTPSRELKAYAGKYDEPAYGRATVTLDDGKLKVAWGRYVFRLDHYHFDTFTAIPVEVPADTSVAQFDRSTFEVQFRLAAGWEKQTEGWLKNTVPGQPNEGNIIDKVAALGAQLGAEVFVVGIARGEQRFKNFADELRQKTCKEVVLWDEAFTTVEASEQLRSAGRRRRDAQREIDMHAAAVILQSYLDHLNRRAS